MPLKKIWFFFANTHSTGELTTASCVHLSWPAVYLYVGRKQHPTREIVMRVRYAGW